MGGTNSVEPFFGTTFPLLFPCLLICLVILGLFGVDQKILKLFGIEYYNDENCRESSYLEKGREKIYS